MFALSKISVQFTCFLPTGADNALVAGACMGTIRLTDFFKYYRGTPKQIEAVEMLALVMPASLLQDDSHWVETYREPDEQVTGGPITNDWDGIKKAADCAGARWPECVAAQWALESNWGKHTSGTNNFFGIKGEGTSCKTWEDYGSGPVNITASFKDFASIQDCVSYLVDRWYLDFRGYSGVNRATSREDCARLLKAEGYATDPAYPEKLISIMGQMS